MADNAQKFPFGYGLNRFAQRKVLDAIAILGRALPCKVESVDGQIVTVSFQVNSSFTLPFVEMPIATSRYDWLPVQPGDLGYTQPSDAYLGGVSGIGGGTADLSTPGNLSALVFVPVANAAWAVPGGDPNMRVVQGPDGVLLQDLGGNGVVSITPTQISLTCADHTIVINESGVIIDGRVFLTHKHTEVMSGGSDTGGVV